MTIADKTFTAPWDIYPQAATGQELGHAANLWDLFTREVTFGGGSTANVITVPDNLASGLELVDAGGIEYMRVDTQNAQPQVHWNIAGADIDYRWEAVGLDPALFIQGNTGFVGIGRVPTGHLDIYDATVDTTVNYYGIYNDHTKTVGVTTEADDLYGLFNYITMDHVGSTCGHIRGILAVARLFNGTVGDGEESITGVFGSAQITGGTAGFDMYGAYFIANLDAGTVANDVFGMYTNVDIEAAMTSIGGDVFGHYISVVDGQGAVGTVYMLYLKEVGGVDYGVYQDGSSDNYLGGNVGIGMLPTANGLLCINTPTETLEIIDAGSAGATEQDWIEVECNGVPGFLHVFAAV